jgi:hypothetical protein
MYTVLSDNQARMLTDTRQLAEAAAHAYEVRDRFRGSMTWRTVNGADYLVRITDSKGGQKSLGRRSPENEDIYHAFMSSKAAASQRVKTIDARLDEQARFNRAARIGRVPRLAARLLRAIDRAKLLGRGVMVIGTNALYAYEAEAAVHIDRDQTATGDVDLLWDVRQRLQLSGEDVSAGLIGILKSVDPTFERIISYRAANADGYFVDLIRPTPTPPELDDGKHSISGRPDGDLEAAEIEGLWWLKNAPALSTIAVAEDGYPVSMSVPHPLAFAAHKQWLSQRIDREPAKRRRDAAQSRIVVALVGEFLPMWRYDEKLLHALPRALHAFIAA